MCVCVCMMLGELAAATASAYAFRAVAIFFFAFIHSLGIHIDDLRTYIANYANAATVGQKLSIGCARRAGLHFDGIPLDCNIADRLGMQTFYGKWSFFATTTTTTANNCKQQKNKSNQSDCGYSISFEKMTSEKFSNNNFFVLTSLRQWLRWLERRQMWRYGNE